MQQLALVCLGGALGSGLRYLVTLAAARWLAPDFPWGTLLVNLSGSFAIGFIQQLTFTVVADDVRLLVTAGLLGGFTTYSAFSYETVRLAESGALRAATLNLALTTVLSLAFCVAGLWLARALTR